MSNEEVYQRLIEKLGFPVHSKKMFGGLGVFSEDVMFGLVYDGVAYLKSTGDESSKYVKEGFQFVPPFGRKAKMPYWNVPEKMMGGEQLLKWANESLEYARASKKRK